MCSPASRHSMAGTVHTSLVVFLKEDIRMRRFISSLTVALALASVASLHAQDAQVKSRTTTKAENAKTVTYTGCVESGSTPQTFVFTHVMPVGQETHTVTGTSGTMTTTTTTYALVPGEKIEFAPHVGHKVQITGIMMSGDIKTKTKTEV